MTTPPSSTTQVIPWKTLHPWQRNQVIAEKVMGITDFRCMGKLDYRGDNTMLRHRYYRCMQCQTTLTITDAWPERWKPQEHNRLTPHYSESMDAAWEIIAHFAQLPDASVNLDTWWRQYKFMAALNVHECAEGGGDYAISLSTLASWTPEMVCIAVLKAVGAQVEL